MTSSKRLDLFTRAFAVGFLACIGISWKFWLSSRTFPLLPIFPFVLPFPFPIDYIFLFIFCALLVGVLIRPRSKILLGGTLLMLSFFFLQDQSRMWSSSYEFFFILLLLVTRRKNVNGEDEASRILNALMLVVALVYFWSGFQKLNIRFFTEAFPWFIEPITALLPFEIPFLPAIAAVGAALQVLFALGFLTKRFRTLALYEATGMHILIFFLIGPLRQWSIGAWIWGLVTAIFAWVLFYQAAPFEFRKIFEPILDFKKSYRLSYFFPYVLVIVFLGLAPVLNNFNLWDAPLSFNVYSGNITEATIYVGKDISAYLPEDLRPHLLPVDSKYYLDIINWSDDEYNAHPYPEKKVYLALMEMVCSFDPDKAVMMVVREKLRWFSRFSIKNPSIETYYCGLVRD